MNWYYQLWQTDAINALIVQSENKECQPFKIFSWSKEVALINVACLQNAAPVTK